MNILITKVTGLEKSKNKALHGIDTVNLCRTHGKNISRFKPTGLISLRLSSAVKEKKDPKEAAKIKLFVL